MSSQSTEKKQNGLFTLTKNIFKPIIIILPCSVEKHAVGGWLTEDDEEAGFPTGTVEISGGSDETLAVPVEKAADFDEVTGFGEFWLSFGWAKVLLFNTNGVAGVFGLNTVDVEGGLKTTAVVVGLRWEEGLEKRCGVELLAMLAVGVRWGVEATEGGRDEEENVVKGAAFDSFELWLSCDRITKSVCEFSAATLKSSATNSLTIVVEGSPLMFE